VERGSGRAGIKEEEAEEEEAARRALCWVLTEGARAWRVHDAPRTTCTYI
jgi:hypothetical protein